MNKVKIICDSTIDFTKEMYEKYDIEVAPLNVAFKQEETVYLDGINIDCESLYQKVEKYKETPKTSAVNVGTWVELYNKYIELGYDILVMTISSELSSCFQNANIAAGEFEEGRIFVVDGKSLSTGSGLLVLKMVEYRDQNLSAKEIFEKVSLLAPKVNAKFCLDRLDYLHNGGRCSGLSMLVAHALHIHPVLKLINGKIIVYKKVRGFYSKAMDEQIEELKNNIENVDTSHIFITASNNPSEDVDYIKNKLIEFIPEENIIITYAGCTICSHCGPKTIGILYLSK